MPNHTQAECDNCGQVDDHPKLHYGAPSGIETYHHDCIPARVRKDLNLDEGRLSAIIEAAASGVHGNELRAHIQELHS